MKINSVQVFGFGFDYFYTVMIKIKLCLNSIQLCKHFEIRLFLYSIQLYPSCFLNIKSTVSIYSIDSKCIVGTCFRYMVSINFIESKYLPKITTVLVNSFDPTSMSEKILPNKIYLTSRHVLTNLIKFKLIVKMMNPFCSITKIEKIKYKLITMNKYRSITVIPNQIKHRFIVSIKYCFGFICAIFGRRWHHFNNYLKLLTTNMHQVYVQFPSGWNQYL